MIGASVRLYVIWVRLCGCFLEMTYHKDALGPWQKDLVVYVCVIVRTKGPEDQRPATR